MLESVIQDLMCSLLVPPQIALACFRFRGSYSREEVGATVYPSVSVFVAVLGAALGAVLGPVL